MTVDGWRELLDVDDPDADALFSDQAVAASTGAMNYGFVWAAGLFKENRDLVSELRTELRASGGQPGYIQALRPAEGRLQASDQMGPIRMPTKVNAHPAAIADVQAHLRELVA